MILGCIGDDFTGSSDLANTLARQGMFATQYSGIPGFDADPKVEAGIVSLKSRTIAAEDAVDQSLRALKWLQRQGCEQFLFKYCSTFDSTPKGNIGQVANALADELNTDTVVVCPAFPGTGRSIYQGHLFVNDTLLNESGMENHPLTPMIDADLRRWLSRQSDTKVGHIPIADVMSGESAIKSAFEKQKQLGHRLIVVDALNDEHLMTIGRASRHLRLITGGSGIALALPDNFKQQGKIEGKQTAWSGEKGCCVALSGSCSLTTRSQINLHKEDNPTMQIKPADIIDCKTTPQNVCQWALTQSGTPLIYSSSDPDNVKKVQNQYGTEIASGALESFFANLAVRLVANGLQKLVVAGGETSGAVVEALAIESMQIGPEIDPGVPALRASDKLVLALKSGNFGASDFFSRAAATLAGENQ